ncbi:MAG: M50 family metallopeptidase [Chloroflexota bacterium]
MIISLLIGVLVLSVVIIAHELGHFTTAKLSGVKVEEFGLGFPPRFLSVMRGETRYSLNVIPFGGFVKMSGEEDPTAPGSLASQSIPTRLLVLSSGALMNVLLALVLLSLAFAIPHDMVVGQVAIKEVAVGSPAATAGIAPGDIIVQINGSPVRNLSDLQRYLHLRLGQETTMRLQDSQGNTREVSLVPRWKPPEGQGTIGALVEVRSPAVVRQSQPFWRAIPTGIWESLETLVLMKNEIIGWFIGTGAPQVAGPVGIAQFTGEVAQAGWSALLEIAALISISIGILQLFPIPAFDGGRIVFVLLEWVRRGKRVSPKVEGIVHTVGFFLLIGLLVIVTYQDIARIISGGSLLP